ncbi:MAG: amidohydrolase family protein [Ilumatobacter sp.]|nr:amidohydrolase family protein [Ilumatobacter sp.]
MTSVLLQGAVTLDDSGAGAPRHRDVRIVDGVISDVGTLPPGDNDDVTDLDGYLLLPAAVEPHAHLDKAFLAERIENPTGDLMGAILAMREHRHLLTVAETVERAERAARLMAANGYRAVRTHADTTIEHGLHSIEALAEVKRRVADVIDVEIVALCGWPVLGPDNAPQRQLLVDALHSGADLVGGCPHLEDGDSRGATEFLLQTATDHGVGVDLHTDETLDPGACGLAELAELVAAGFEHSVTASHCVSLGMQPESVQRVTAEAVAAAGIGVVALPHTNLFLQGRGHLPMPRGLTAVDALRAAGVRVAAGADNLQDPFNPVGRACPFETAGLMILAAHLLPADAWQSVSAVAADVTGAPPAGIAAGSRADLVAVRATTLREAIAFGPVDRIVWRHGRRLAT